MKPPDCEVCDERFDPPDGALLTFAARPSDTAWRERAERERIVGHPPDTGWFCSDHAAAARELVHLTFPEAMARLRPPAPPSEPTWVQRFALDVDRRMRHDVPFTRPVPVRFLDEAIRRCSDSYEERWHSGPLFPRREPVPAGELVHLETTLAPVPDELDADGGGPRCVRPLVTAVVAGDEIVAVRIGRGLDHHLRRLALLFAELLCRETDDWRSPGCDICGGLAPAESVGTIVAYADRPRSVRAAPEPERTDRFPSFVGTYCEVHAPTADRLARIRRGDAELLMRHGLLGAHLGDILPDAIEETVHLPIVPTEVGLVFRLLGDLIPQLAAALGVEPPELERSSSRRWNPMDRVGPPDCPFTAETVLRGSDGPLEVHLSSTGNYWSEDDVANERAKLALAWIPNGRSPRHDPERWEVSLVAASSETDGARAFADRLWWRLPLVPAAVPVVAELVAALGTPVDT